MRLFELATDHMHGTGKYQVVGGIVSPLYMSQSVAISSEPKSSSSLEDCQTRLDLWQIWVFPGVNSEGRYHYGRILKEYEQSTGMHTNSSSNTAPISSKNSLLLVSWAEMLCVLRVNRNRLDEHVEEVVGHFGLVSVSRGERQPKWTVHESDTLSRHQQNIFLVREWLKNETSATEVQRALRRGLSLDYLIPDPEIAQPLH
ncbi:hypothetical protein JOB18_049171 [Solea senegalensis]|uniref:Uncharacterized protein n=1 Tax=Solea senegalensis TaxID=28829 RepID=A0AAV6TCH2_SOLSE|nr:hypothetical protein JOB18_049171 [Solea senegalensis]